MTRDQGLGFMGLGKLGSSMLSFWVQEPEHQPQAASAGPVGCGFAGS